MISKNLVKSFFIVVLLCLLGEGSVIDSNGKCPAIVAHLCDYFSDRLDKSAVAKCKVGMGILWKRGTDESKYMLLTAAKVEKYYENEEENQFIGSLPASSRRACRVLTSRACRAIKKRNKSSSSKCGTPYIRHRKRKGIVCGKFKNNKKPNCKGANAASVACGVAGVVLGLFSFGSAGLALGFGCAVAGGAIAGICGI